MFAHTSHSSAAERHAAEENPTNIEPKKVNSAGGSSTQQYQQYETVLGVA
jgi:hypothetical protein